MNKFVIIRLVEPKRRRGLYEKNATHIFTVLSVELVVQRWRREILFFQKSRSLHLSMYPSVGT